MKKNLLVIMLIACSFLFEKASAQIHADLKINIDLQPVWGPTGYDHVDYYYMPDIDAYYNVPRHQYIYQDRGRWIFAASLPSRFHDYDLNSGYKVVINDPKPYMHNDIYKTKYASFRGRQGKEIIRNSHDSKYFEIKEHPEHDKWVKDHNGHH